MAIQSGVKTVKVWDPLVRIFHWSMVALFALAWLTAEELDTVHIWLGYAVASLVFFRVVWGFIGTRYARFSDFVYRWSTIVGYLKSLLTTHPKHYLGHNPAGGLMVLLLLLSLATLTFTGMVLIASDGDGPLAGTVFASFSGDWAEDIHEAMANMTLALVFIHIAGVVVSSLLHRENLVKAMISGEKEMTDNEVRDETA